MRLITCIVSLLLLCTEAGAFTPNGPGNRSGAKFMQQQNQGLDVFVTIAKYIKTANSEKLSLWLDKSIDLQLMGRSNQCSKVQATHILTNFFKEYPPRDFVIIHKSGQAPAKYAIGSLNCGDDRFKITLFVKTEQGTTTIRQIIIERD